MSAMKPHQNKGSLLAAWCVGCSKRSKERLRPAWAEITTTLAVQRKSLDLCPGCWKSKDDSVLTQMFARQFGVDASMVAVESRVKLASAAPGTSVATTAAVTASPPPTSVPARSVLAVLKVAQALGVTDPWLPLRCPNCKGRAAVSGDGMAWRCIGGAELPEDPACGAGGDAMDFAGHVLERREGLDSGTPDFRETVERWLASKGIGE